MGNSALGGLRFGKSSPKFAEEWMPEHKVCIGNVELVSLSDGHLVFPVGEFFPSVPAEAWAPYRDQLTPDGKVVLNVGSFLLRSDGKTILVDTGLGQNPQGLRDAAWGRLLKDMKEKGLSPGEVDMVAITHLHQDHVGWNIVGEGDGRRPTFPNARYWVPQADWRVYTRRAGMSAFSYIRDQVLPLEELGVLELMDGERALTYELTALPTPGHTPGHTSFVVSSQGQRAVVLGDVTHMPAQVHETDWSPRADTDPDLSRSTRRELMERADQEDAMLISGHFPAPGYGRLVRLHGRRSWRAL